MFKNSKMFEGADHNDRKQIDIDAEGPKPFAPDFIRGIINEAQKSPEDKAFEESMKGVDS